MSSQKRRTNVVRPPRQRSALRSADVARLSFTGLVSRPSRAILSALAIAIGIAAMTSVVGISASSQAQLNDQLARLGTNLLTAQAGESITGGDVRLPPSSVGKVKLLDGVVSASGTGNLPGIHVYRTRLIEKGATGGIGVSASDLDLLEVTGTRLEAGDWLNEATANLPAVVLGYNAAQTLGVHSIGTEVWLAEQAFTVVGILQRAELAGEIDDLALIGRPFAQGQLDYSGSPDRIYERSNPERVASVRQRLAGTINPAAPNEVRISRPSDALAAQAASDQAFNGLLTGLGGIALLVGGIGVANTMIISVLERRREIGLRRALGATRAHIRVQFTAEALLLAAAGGAGGALIGVVAIAAVAAAQGWPFAPPPLLFPAAAFGTIIIGAVAGLYPAVRAARTPPTAALNS